jgi:hypothetical protein
MMLVAIEGVYRRGKIELKEVPRDMDEGTRVVVTFLPANGIDLQSRGINETEAAKLRGSLAAFAEDWDDLEMSVYDNYDAANTNL